MLPLRACLSARSRQTASALFDNGPPHLRFDASTHSDPAERVEAWRDAFAASGVAFAPREVAYFAAGADFHEPGPARLNDTRYIDHAVVSHKRTIARKGGVGYQNSVLEKRHSRFVEPMMDMVADLPPAIMAAYAAKLVRTMMDQRYRDRHQRSSCT